MNFKIKVRHSYDNHSMFVLIRVNDMPKSPTLIQQEIERNAREETRSRDSKTKHPWKGLK